MADSYLSLARGEREQTPVPRDDASARRSLTVNLNRASRTSRAAGVSLLRKSVSNSRQEACDGKLSTFPFKRLRGGAIKPIVLRRRFLYRVRPRQSPTATRASRWEAHEQRGR